MNLATMPGLLAYEAAAMASNALRPAGAKFKFVVGMGAGLACFARKGKGRKEVKSSLRREGRSNNRTRDAEWQCGGRDDTLTALSRGAYLCSELAPLMFVRGL